MESDGDCVEPREGEPESAGNVSSDDYGCTEMDVDATDSSFRLKGQDQVVKR